MAPNQHCGKRGCGVAALLAILLTLEEFVCLGANGPVAHQKPLRSLLHGPAIAPHKHEDADSVATRVMWAMARGHSCKAAAYDLMGLLEDANFCAEAEIAQDLRDQGKARIQ